MLSVVRDRRRARGEHDSAELIEHYRESRSREEARKQMGLNIQPDPSLLKSSPRNKEKLKKKKKDGREGLNFQSGTRLVALSFSLKLDVNGVHSPLSLWRSGTEKSWCWKCHKADVKRKSEARKREICFSQTHFYIFMTLMEINRCQDE